MGARGHKRLGLGQAFAAHGGDKGQALDRTAFSDCIQGPKLLIHSEVRLEATVFYVLLSPKLLMSRRKVHSAASPTANGKMQHM